MTCPECSNENSRVVDSRTLQTGIIRRRRKCTKCEARWTTYEETEKPPVEYLTLATELENELAEALNKFRRAIQ